jgi:predicted permease
MIWLRKIFHRLRSSFPNARQDQDLDAEIASHLELATEENISRGMSPEEARRRALVRFGGVEQATAHNREARGIAFFDILSQDFRYAFRTLRRDPSFTVIALVILALAIGANVAVFSVVNTLLLRPLPFPDSHQLVWIAPPPNTCGFSCSTYSADGYEGLRDQSRVYEGVSGYMAFTTADNMSLTGRGEPEPATSIEVIGNFFQVLGVQPAMGRLFTSEDSAGNPHPVAVLSNAYWRRQFASDPEIVGKAIELNGTPITVMGVLPDSFDFGAVFSPGAKVDLFTPLNLNQERNWGNIVTLLGRMKPGVTVAQALDDANRVAPNLYFNVKYPATLGRYKGDLIPVPLKAYVTGKLRHSLIALWCAVGVILLIAGVNLSNLLLARSMARAREFAVRGAVGASRGRIVRQLLMESLVLSGAGALLGLALALLLTTWLAHQGSVALPLLSHLRIDGEALGWTVLTALFTATIFGLLPGLRIAAGNLQQMLKDSGPSVGLGRSHERVRATLVVFEVALACVLLVSAGLLLRSFVKVLDVDLGFQPEHAASISVDYDDTAPTNEARANRRGEIFQQIIARVAALPGVEVAGISDYLPLGPNREWDSPVPQGKIFAPGELPGPLVYVVTPGFIHALGIRMHGRDFTWSDGPHSERVVLINASAARVYWPGEDAIGKILMRAHEDDEKDRVIGVVDDVHEETVEQGTGAQIYYPVTQQSPSGAQLVVRTSLPPATLAASVLRALRELNPKQPAAEFRPIQTVVDRAVSPRRFFMILVVAFASLGLLLASLGIYGVISYSVTCQTREIGIRMALGASEGRVQAGVISRTLRMAGAGIVLGTLASLAVARSIDSLLYGTGATDPTAYVSMVLLLGTVAFVAGYIPARRASRVNPSIALRNN